MSSRNNASVPRLSAEIVFSSQKIENDIHCRREGGIKSKLPLRLKATGPHNSQCFKA